MAGRGSGRCLAWPIGGCEATLLCRTGAAPYNSTNSDRTLRIDAKPTYVDAVTDREARP